MVVIGLHKTLWKDFVDRKIIDCPTYIDPDHTIYKGLKKGKLWWLFSRAILKMAKAGGKFGGANTGPDGMQMGGLVVVANVEPQVGKWTNIVEKNSKSQAKPEILFQWEQSNFGDHPSCETVLKGLGLKPVKIETSPAPSSSNAQPLVCESKEQCS